MADRDGIDPPAAPEVVADRQIGDRDLTRRATPAGKAAAHAVATASRRLGAQRTLILILAIGAGAAFLLAFAASRVYDAVSEADGISAIDQPALTAAVALRTPLLDGVAAAAAYLFGPIGMPVIALTACVLLAAPRRSITPITLTVAAGVGSLLITVAGKGIVGRHRPRLTDAIPPFEYSPSFPSGHTLNATVIFGLLAYLLILRRTSAAARVTLGITAGLIAVGVGLTRVLLGAHWLTDVLAGWLLGAAWLAIIITAHRLHLTALDHHRERVRWARRSRGRARRETALAPPLRDERRRCAVRSALPLPSACPRRASELEIACAAPEHESAV